MEKTSLSDNSWFLIVNPTSGNKSFSKNWSLIQKYLTDLNFNYSFAFTKFSKHEINLVKTAIKKGFKNIIAVGGDGTLHHVVNGIMMQTYVNSFDITVGVIPLGTGNDWIKTYNIPNDLKKSIQIIHKKKILKQDIGVIKSENNTTYFNNVGGIGYDAFVVKKIKPLKKLGSLSYTIAGLLGMLQYQKSDFKFIINKKIYREKCLMIIFGIGKYSGGGMQFTKDVNPQNGLLDITVVKKFNLFDLIFNLPKLYNGKIVHHHKVETFKTSNIKINSKKINTYHQADGELLLGKNISVSIVPKAISFVIN